MPYQSMPLHVLVLSKREQWLVGHVAISMLVMASRLVMDNELPNSCMLSVDKSQDRLLNCHHCHSSTMFPPWPAEVFPQVVVLKICLCKPLPAHNPHFLPSPAAAPVDNDSDRAISRQVQLENIGKPYKNHPSAACLTCQIPWIGHPRPSLRPRCRSPRSGFERAAKGVMLRLIHMIHRGIPPSSEDTDH